MLEILGCGNGFSLRQIMPPAFIPLLFFFFTPFFFLILCFFSSYAWVMVLFSQSPKPGPYVKEMNDAATFYTNRVLKDYKHRYVPSFTRFLVELLLLELISACE